ncbi:MAG: flippase [Candidatus Anammoxibacter sp.]
MVIKKQSIINKFDNHMKEVVRGTSITFLLKVASAGLGFSFNVLLARTVGADGAGIYYMALTITTIAYTIGLFGLKSTFVRFIASNASVEDWVVVKGVYQKGVLLALAISAVSSLVMFSAAPWLSETVFSKPELTKPMRLMALAVIPTTMLILHAEALKGLKRIRDYNLVNGVGVPVVLIIGLYLFVPKLGVTGAILAYTIAAILVAFGGFLLWRSATSHMRNIVGRFEMQKLLHSCLPLFWISFMRLVRERAAIIMLGIWCTNEDVGVFGVSFRTVMLTSFILVAVNSIVAPKFAELYKQNNLKALSSTAKNSAKMIMLMSSPIFLMVFLFPEWVLGFFGSKFVDGTTVLRILAGGQFVSVMVGPVGSLLIMSGHERLQRNNVICFAVVNILLNIFLIPRYGIVGAAFSNASTLALLNITAAILVYKKLSINMLPISGLRFLYRR